MRERDRFIYAKLDVAILTHPKAQIAGAAAVGIYLLSVAYCRLHCPSGRMPKEAALALLGGQGALSYDALTQPRVAWWVDHGEEIEVWNYAKKNQTGEEIETAKEAARGRAAASRARSDAARAAHVQRTCGVSHALVGGELPSSNSISDLRDQDQEIESHEEQASRQRTPGGDESGVHRAAPLADPAGEFEIGERWRDGVAEGSGVRPARPMGAELRKLAALVYEQASPGGGIEGQRARSQTAFDLGRKYGEAHRDQIRNVHRFADWVGSGCPAVAPRSGRTAFARQPLAPARAPPSFTAEDALREGEETMRRMAKGEF